MQPSSQWRHMYNKGKQFEGQFFIYEPKCKINVYFGLFRGPWRGLQWSDWAYLAFQLSSHPYLCTYQIRKQSEKKFLSLNPKYENNLYFFHIWGYWGALMSNPGERKFHGSKNSSQSRHMYNKGKNNHQFFKYGPQYTKMCIFGYSGVSGWPINNQTGPIFLPSYPLTYVNLHIKYKKQSDKDF